MLGRRRAQRSFFDGLGLPHRVSPDSFYGRMAAVMDLLFRDDDLKHMYCPDNGRPSLSPALLCGILLLQFYDDVSDAEAVERTMYDIRWKVALNLPLDYPGFDPSSLSVFRRRLLGYGEERYAFDRFVEVGRAAGFIPEMVTMLIDTTPVKGAGAVQDTYTLLRKGIRKLLKALGYHLPGKRQGLSAQVQQLVATYLDHDRKAQIDWTDPKQRAAQLQVLVREAEAVLDLATEQTDDDEVRATGWLLTKILGDDITTDEHGHPQMGKGTAPDRIISVTDPEMRHGHKSSAHRFDGFKVSVATEATSEMILDITDIPAAGSDGKELLPTIARVEEHADVVVERVIGDGAYASGENRAACATGLSHSVDLLAPLRQPPDPEVDKSAFQIDEEAQTATCPQGQTVAGRPGRDQDGRPISIFYFARDICVGCPLFSRCVHSASAGRTVRTHYYEGYLRAARERQKTDEFRDAYRVRSDVERKQAELVRHGIRDTRYMGEPKRQLQRLWTGAMVNLKRLFTLAETRSVDLTAVVLQLRPLGLTPAYRAPLAQAA
jgi:transposase